MKSIKLTVNASNFVEHLLDEQVGDNDNPSFGMRKIELDDYFAYKEQVPEIIREGVLRVIIEEVNFQLMKAISCIKYGGRGDEDGYGVEPDTWIIAYLNLDKEFVSPFALEDSSKNRNISNLLVAGINPMNEDGTIRICPFDKVEKDFRLKGYFQILQGDNWGFANNNLEPIIPPTYKIIYGDRNGLVCFHQHNNLCGLLNLENKVLIPALYDYLNYIDAGMYLGFYKAKLNGKTGILSRNNDIVENFV